MKATIGRIVHYTFPASEPLGYSLRAGQTRTVPAMIVAVWTDECVNLRVFQDGLEAPISATSVTLKNADTPEESEYWEWPPRVSD